MTQPTEQEKEIDEAIDQLWERGHVPKFADDVKTGIKRIAHTYGNKRAEAVVKALGDLWPEPSDKTGEGGPGPLFTSGLLTQYEEDRKRHNTCLEAARQATHHDQK